MSERILLQNILFQEPGIHEPGRTTRNSYWCAENGWRVVLSPDTGLIHLTRGTYDKATNRVVCSADAATKVTTRERALEFVIAPPEPAKGGK